MVSEKRTYKSPLLRCRNYFTLRHGVFFGFRRFTPTHHSGLRPPQTSDKNQERHVHVLQGIRRDGRHSFGFEQTCVRCWLSTKINFRSTLALDRNELSLYAGSRPKSTVVRRWLSAEIDLRGRATVRYGERLANSQACMFGISTLDLIRRIHTIES